MKPYLIAVSSYTPGEEKYASTMEALGDSVEHQHTVLDVYPGHLKRWDHLPKELDPNRWWIFTDTSDVIFQAPIPDLDETGRTMLLAFEGVGFKDNGFWTAIINEHEEFTPLLSSPIFNVGCFAMRGHEVRDWIAYLQARRHKYSNQACEQLLFNQWLNAKPMEKIGVHPTLFTTLYANLELGLCKKTEEGKFVNQKGQVYSVVHANGSTKHNLDG